MLQILLDIIMLVSLWQMAVQWKQVKSQNLYLTLVSDKVFRLVSIDLEMV